MKKFISVVCCLLVIAIAGQMMFYRFGVYVDLKPNQKVTSFMTTDNKNIYMKTPNGKKDKFEIKGVDMGVGIPGKFATDYAIDKETYLKWFEEIYDMGANTIRVYTILSDDFYKAFYEYNKNNETPLYLIQGIWVDDYVQNSHVDAYGNDYIKQLIKDCKTVVNLLHGNTKLSLGNGAGNGNYAYDISKWVIGYIIGVEWEDVTVAYTDNEYKGMDSYSGKYMYSTPNASPFETMLAKVGDSMISYESKRYKEQRLIAFSNWPTTDPFDYPENVSDLFMKCAKVDVEHIKTTDEFISGQFASYHVYPYYPDYLSYVDDPTTLDGINSKKDLYDEKGRLNTYRAYLKMLTSHHTMPVVISEFGVSAGRGMAQKDKNTNRNQGNTSESEQGKAIVDCYNDIIASGCAGCAVFSWQDEWFKRTWNTMYAVNLKRTPYWSDYQTNEQYFGLLSFDPGKETSVCYVDGRDDEWTNEDIVSTNNNMKVSMKYDEKFVYFKVDKKGFDINKDKIYIPIDTTQKSGSKACKNFGLKFDRNADFIICINGKNNSRVMVQERYESLRSTYLQETNGKNAYSNIPSVSSSVFKNINMILQTQNVVSNGKNNDKYISESFETGHLTYGDANPSDNNFNSLADFCDGDGFVEIKLPWQLLNFSDPSKMQIHDDYYINFGVKSITIDKMYVGAGIKNDLAIIMNPFPLNGWGNNVTYHERLKSSYYILKDAWSK